MSFPNRLARQGEELITYKFPRGSMGLASRADVRAQNDLPISRIEKALSRLRDVLDKSRPYLVRPVCVPPGARLLVRDISDQLQREMKIRQTEEAIFTQLSATACRHRDALRFRNGRHVLLQMLQEGQRVRVLDISLAEATDPHAEALSRLDRDVFALSTPTLAAA